ncbi:hypothetical protein CYMTET_2627 [Cymbomonas tetramitiformis]|uniref:Uncharacterized protein n=1 Tax=Cymbomonas tetramitiformis TaxID=36881 RepID=A0AAE0H4Q5_9CHLO|nr:hypothetical protein CYMTET_2627 [Cymbomonas tetramitiformis]
MARFGARREGWAGLVSGADVDMLVQTGLVRRHGCVSLPGGGLSVAVGGRVLGGTVIAVGGAVGGTVLGETVVAVGGPEGGTVFGEAVVAVGGAEGGIVLGELVMEVGDVEGAA